MLKILQINKFYYLRGGSERYFFELEKLLKSQGHKVITFSMFDPRNEPNEYGNYFAENVSVDRFSLKSIVKSFYNWDAVRRLKKLIDQEKPDFAHLHNIANHLSPAIIKVLKDNGIKIIQTLHDYKLICPNRQLFSRRQVCLKCQGSRFYHCFLGKCVQNSYPKSFLGMLEAYYHVKYLKTYDKIDLFLAPSRFMKEICVRFGIPEEKIKVIHNFVPNDFIKIRQAAETASEKSHEYLLYFGRLSEEKGINVLLDAVKQNKSRLKLKIIGIGPDYKKIDKFVKRNRLENKVEISGPKYGDALQAIIFGAKAVVMPSVWLENFPYSLLETMAMGKIAIASNIGGIPEIIIDNENGFLFLPGDSRDLAGKIEKLGQVDLEKMGEKARQTVLSFSQDKHYDELMGIYGCLLKK